MQHLSADGYAVTVGARFWTTDDMVVEIEEVAVGSSSYGGGVAVRTWHAATGGRRQYTLSGPLYTEGPLRRRLEGRDASFLPVGTLYNARGSAAARVAS